MNSGLSLSVDQSHLSSLGSLDNQCGLFFLLNFQGLGFGCELLGSDFSFADLSQLVGLGDEDASRNIVELISGSLENAVLLVARRILSRV